MNSGRLVFAQIMQHLPLTTFRRCVARYDGEHKVKSFSCLDQYLSLAFAQLTYRESLRDIEACLRAQASSITLASGVACRGSPLAGANEVRDWRIHADLAQSLIGIARRLYVDEPFGVDLKETVYVFPAQAGMNRLWRVLGCRCRSVPRAGGDEPSFAVPRSGTFPCSPRRRG